jgi:tellurite methyltransferase
VIEDRDKWNQTYHNQPPKRGTSPIVERFSGLATGRVALDVACGQGSNAKYLADEGFTVDAVDISIEGLKSLKEHAPQVRSLCVDLDVFDIPASRYDLIINIRYLNRRLVPQMIEGLRPGGVLIFETYLLTGEEDRRRFRKDYLLRENELLHLFLPLRILFYEERSEPSESTPGTVASLVAMKPTFR